MNLRMLDYDGPACKVRRELDVALAFGVLGMGFCPICKTSANLEQPNGGDYRRVECGKYQITGSALAMLPARLPKDDPKSVARLSHATRLMSMSTDAEWPEINSVNLDEMLKQPLPTIDRQMTNLLTWATAHLGGRWVDQLISQAETQGLVEFVPDNCISVTAKGWGRLEPPSPVLADEATARPQSEPAAKEDQKDQGALQ
jgi:hypothetical protein